MFSLVLTIFLVLIFIISIFLFTKTQRYNLLKNLSYYFRAHFRTNNVQENPDINTINWDLHRKRLEKFGRSQYKGLTFFITPQGSIYYLSENGLKVYC